MINPPDNRNKKAETEESASTFVTQHSGASENQMRQIIKSRSASGKPIWVVQAGLASDGSITLEEVVEEINSIPLEVMQEALDSLSSEDIKKLKLDTQVPTDEDVLYQETIFKNAGTVTTARRKVSARNRELRFRFSFLDSIRSIFVEREGRSSLTSEFDSYREKWRAQTVKIDKLLDSINADEDAIDV